MLEIAYILVSPVHTLDPFYYILSVVENVAGRNKSQEKRTGVFISAVAAGY